jgi:hypothetical protein
MYQPISTGATTSKSTPRKMVLAESPCGNGHQNRTIDRAPRSGVRTTLDGLGGLSR